MAIFEENGSLIITGGRDDTDRGIKFRTNGETFDSYVITPQGLVKAGDGLAAPVTPAAPSTGPLAVVRKRSAAVGTALSYSVTSTGAFVDFSAADLAVTFTAPASGRVKVTLEATCAGDAGTDKFWGLREGAATLQTAGVDYSVYINNNGGQSRVTATFDIAVTAGSHTIKWAGRIGAAGTFYLTSGTTGGDIVMTVEAA